jgi:hypothetical protein
MYEGVPIGSIKADFCRICCAFCQSHCPDSLSFAWTAALELLSRFSVLSDNLSRAALEDWYCLCTKLDVSILSEFVRQELAWLYLLHNEF